MGDRAGFRLDGKVAVVTGASRGLGRAIALGLARAGASTVLVARSAERLEETSGAIRRDGGRALAVPLDVTDAGTPEVGMAASNQHFGRVDILVVSAGVGITRPALEVTPVEWDQVLGVNLRAAFFWAQAAARAMVSGSGRIIFLTSVGGTSALPQLAPYCASKGGLIALTKTLAVEWARLGITVNAIAPGYVLTDLNADVLADARVREHIIQRTPLHRLGDPADVAAAALFLASDEAAFITGHVLSVDGGWLAR